MDRGLGQRIFDFSVNTILYLRKLPKSTEYDVLKRQLIRSSTSAGANYEEAQGASSKADFKHKITLSLKEMRETNYWFRILYAIKGEDSKLVSFSKESEELKKILGSICSKLK